MCPPHSRYQYRNTLVVAKEEEGGGIMSGKHDEETFGLVDPRSLMMGRDRIEPSWQSIIECGIVIHGQRVLKQYCDFFGSTVEVFTAVSDPMRRVLYRPNLIAKKMGCSTSRIGMHLNRYKNKEQLGVYQSTGFTHKPQSDAVRLRTGAYFISMDACKDLEARSQNMRRSVSYKKQGGDSSGADFDPENASGDLPSRNKRSRTSSSPRKSKGSPKRQAAALPFDPLHPQPLAIPVPGGFSTDGGHFFQASQGFQGPMGNASGAFAYQSANQLDIAGLRTGGRGPRNDQTSGGMSADFMHLGTPTESYLPNFANQSLGTMFSSGLVSPGGTQNAHLASLLNYYSNLSAMQPTHLQNAPLDHLGDFSNSQRVSQKSSPGDSGGRLSRRGSQGMFSFIPPTDLSKTGMASTSNDQPLSPAAVDSRPATEHAEVDEITKNHSEAQN